MPRKSSTYPPAASRGKPAAVATHEAQRKAAHHRERHRQHGDDDRDTGRPQEELQLGRGQRAACRRRRGRGGGREPGLTGVPELPAIEDGAQLAVALHVAERLVDGAQERRLAGPHPDGVDALPHLARIAERRAHEAVAVGDDVVEHDAVEPSLLQVEVGFLAPS